MRRHECGRYYDAELGINLVTIRAHADDLYPPREEILSPGSLPNTVKNSVRCREYHS